MEEKLNIAEILEDAPTGTLYIRHTIYNIFIICDNKRVSIGNCFQTKLEAFNARDKISKII
jgi:hypothetical protein